MYKSKQNLDILYRAFDEYCKYYMTTLPGKEELEKITFSPEFEAKMEKLVNKQKKPYYYMINTVAKRVACIIVAFIAVLTTLTFSVKALREPVVKFFVHTFRRFSTITFDDEYIDDSFNQGITTFYAPTYLPEGYVNDTEVKGFATYYIKYKNSTNECIIYRQDLITPSALYTDTEDATTSYINDGETLLIVKDDTKKIIWHDEKYMYILTTPGHFSEEELLKIADSIEEIE